MKSYVFTILDDRCAVNEKDPTASDLLLKMKEYGSVESYDSAILAMKQQYQKSIDNITNEYNRIKDLDLSDDEIKIINSYRECRENAKKELQEEVTSYKVQLEELKAESEKRVEKIKQLLEQI